MSVSNIDFYGQGMMQDRLEDSDWLELPGERAQTSMESNDSWGSFAGRCVRNMLITTAIGVATSYLMPSSSVSGVATDVFRNLAARSYDVTTCLGQYNACVGACLPDPWGQATACMIGCHIAYGICTWMGG